VRHPLLIQRLLAPLLVIASGVGWSVDAAGRSGVPLRFGVSGGYHATANEFDVLGTRTEGSQVEPSALFGLRLGYQPTALFGLELSASLMPASTQVDGGATLLPVHLDITLRPFDATVQPYVAAGGGVFALVGGDAGSDTDALLHAAVGLEWTIDSSVAIRLEGALYATDAINDAFSFNPAILLGIDILAWRDGSETTVGLLDDDGSGVTTPPVRSNDPSDPDGDDIRGAADVCPSHAGTLSTGGCPDTDRDGVVDAFDRCPTQAGADGKPCPDSDADGISDDRDGCVYDAGPAQHLGCPTQR
jgi:hypothetical protein